MEGIELIFLAFSFGILSRFGHGRKRVGTSPCHSATESRHDDDCNKGL